MPDLFNLVTAGSSEGKTGEYDTISWVFRILFVENILRIVNGEDEIWMVESGVRNRLHRWVVE